MKIERVSQSSRDSNNADKISQLYVDCRGLLPPD